LSCSHASSVRSFVSSASLSSVSAAFPFRGSFGYLACNPRRQMADRVKLPHRLSIQDCLLFIIFHFWIGRVIPAFCSRQIAAVNGAVFLLNNFGTIERDVPLILSAHRVRSLGAACHETACFGSVILPRNGRSITWRICENHTRGQPNSIRLQLGQSGPQCWLGRSCFYPGIFIFELCAGNAYHAGTRLLRLFLQRVAFLSRCVAF